MARETDPDLSPAQLQIMNIVWDRGEVGVAEIWQELSRTRAVARNTVQTMVSRLADKRWLKHRQEGNAFYYTAAQPRKRVLGRLVSRLVDAAFGGSASGLVLTLLDDSKLSPDEARRIRRMIEQAESKRSKRS
jgi:predicted transcriptional regulator